MITFNVRNTPMKSALLAEAYTARNWGNQNAHSAVGDSKSLHWRVEGAGSVDLFYSWRPERKSKLPWGTQEASGRTGAETSPLTLGPVFLPTVSMRPEECQDSESCPPSHSGSSHYTVRKLLSMTDQILVQFLGGTYLIRREQFINLCVPSEQTQLSTCHLGTFPVCALFTLPSEIICPFTEQMFVEYLLCARH